jgi:hypothetical protein
MLSVCNVVGHKENSLKIVPVLADCSLLMVNHTGQQNATDVIHFKGHLESQGVAVSPGMGVGARVNETFLDRSDTFLAMTLALGAEFHNFPVVAWVIKHTIRCHQNSISSDKLKIHFRASRGRSGHFQKAGRTVKEK